MVFLLSRLLLHQFIEPLVHATEEFLLGENTFWRVNDITGVNRDVIHTYKFYYIRTFYVIRTKLIYTF